MSMVILVKNKYYECCIFISLINLFIFFLIINIIIFFSNVFKDGFNFNLFIVLFVFKIFSIEFNVSYLPFKLIINIFGVVKTNLLAL